MSHYYVRIHYGPYEAFHTYSHKPQKLYGLRLGLQKLGYRVDLVPCDLIEHCAIEMCGHEVFRCNIRHLQFNMGEPRDPLCQRAIEAVKLANTKMNHARSYLWACMLIESQILKNKYAPENQWNLDADFKPFGRTCADCCHIFVAGNPDERNQDKLDNKYTYTPYT